MARLQSLFEVAEPARSKCDVSTKNLKKLGRANRSLEFQWATKALGQKYLPDQPEFNLQFHCSSRVTVDLIL